MPTLSIDIEARFAKFQDGLDKIDRDVGRATRNMSRSFGALKGVAAGLIGTLAGFAGVRAFKSVIDDLDRLHTVSERTGISAEKLVGLALAAKQTGTDLEVAARGISKLNIGLSELATGGKTDLKDTLTQLGLPEFAKGAIDAEEALLQLAEVFPRLSDADQARVSVETFGEKIGSSLIPMLQGGREELERFFRVGKENAGGIDELAKAADEFNDAMTSLSFLLKATLLPVLQMLSPLFKSLAENIIAAKQAGTGFYELLPVEKTRASLALLNKDLEGLRKQQAEFESGKASGKGITGTLNKWFNGSMGDVSQVIPIKERQIAALEKRIAETEKDATRVAKAKDSVITLKAIPDKVKATKAHVERDDSAQRLLDQQLKAFERSIAEERDIAQTRNDFLQRFYDDGLISLGDYSKGRVDIMEESAQKQRAAIGSEIALLEASKKGKAGDDRIAIDTKINDLLDKQAELNRDVAISGQNLFLDNAREARDFADELQRVNIALMQSKGDFEGAARAQFALEDRDLNTRLDTAAASGATAEERAAATLAKEQNNELRERSIQMERFNALADETNRIRNDAADAEERVGLAIENGTVNQIEGMRQIAALRKRTSELLTEQGEKMENIALLTKDPAQMDSVKALGMEIEHLNSQLDPLKDKFEDMATHGLSGFFEKVASGTVSAKDAFKSMIADWTAEITKFMVQAAVKQLIAGFASSMAGGAGGGGGGSAGLAASMFAEGGQVTGAGSGTSDSIPVLLSNKEFVVRAKPTQEPGALAFLTRFNKLGMKSLPRYSSGGLVGRMGMASGGLAMAGGGMTLVQNFTVEARTPKETQQQLASSAYQGGMRAYRRNR